MGLLETMKVELELMRREKIYMEALLTAAETALQEKKRAVSMHKAMAKLADDLLDVIMEAGGVDNSHGQELDEETIKELVEEAIRDFNQALKEALSPGNGGNDGRSADDRNLDGTNGKEAGGSRGGHNAGNA